MSVPTQIFNSPKEALHHDFTLGSEGAVEVKLGQGRMSNKAKERLDVLLALGWKVSGYVRDTSEPEAKPGVTVTKPAPRAQRVAVVKEDPVWKSPDEYRYTLDQHEAVADDGTKFGMREGCNNCRFSLVDHRCESPSVLGVPVTVRRK